MDGLTCSSFLLVSSLSWDAAVTDARHDGQGLLAACLPYLLGGTSVSYSFRQTYRHNAAHITSNRKSAHVAWSGRLLMRFFQAGIDSASWETVHGGDLERFLILPDLKFSMD